MTNGTTAPGPGSAPQEPVEGKKKTPKVKAAKPEGANGEEKVSRPRLPKFPETDVITVLKPGSKARTAADRFDQYRTGMTVKEYIDTMTKEPWNRPASMVWADLRWDKDEKRGFIHIGPTVVDIPPPPPPKEKKAKKVKPEVIGGTEHQPAAE